MFFASYIGGLHPLSPLLGIPALSWQKSPEAKSDSDKLNLNLLPHSGAGKGVRGTAFFDAGPCSRVAAVARGKAFRRKPASSKGNGREKGIEPRFAQCIFSRRG